MTKFAIAAVAAPVLMAALMAAPPAAAELPGQAQVVERSKSLTPSPPWPAGDERGMANTLGAGTWQRCAFHLGQSNAKSYEVSHVRSNTMPLSPFSVPFEYEYRGTASIPGTRHAFNGEHLKSGEPGAQGTQFDALGHFAHLAEPWDGKPPIPVDTATYYGGFKQSDVKPSGNSPLLKLGMEKVPPIVTTAVLLDARTYVGGGRAMTPGQLITAADIEAMLAMQGLAWRSILPGDALYIYTGWSDNWVDPDVKKTYYTAGPGLSYDAAQYIGQRQVVLVGLDVPFIDPVNTGQLMGKAPPAEGSPAGLPFAVHHHLLTQAGIHHMESANLKALAADKVWTSCAMILPLRSKGGHGSPIRPVSIGVPNQ